MKGSWKAVAVLMLVSAIGMGGKGSVAAKTIAEVDSQAEDLKVVTETKPHTLNSGSESDFSTFAYYHVTCSENEKEGIIIPVKISKRGEFIYYISSSVNYNGTVGGATVGLYEDEQGTRIVDQEKKISFESKDKQELSQSAYIEKAGTYYIKIAISSDAASANGSYFFALGMQACSSENRTLKNKKWTVAFGDGTSKAIYYKVVVKKTGYITLQTEYDKAYGKANISLCNHKKKRLSVVCKQSKALKNKEVFAVKKGTYYVKVNQAAGEYRLKSTFQSVSDKSGSSKAKAKAFTTNGSAQVGLILLSDSSKKADWYSFHLSSRKIVDVTLQGSTSGDSKVSLEIIPPQNMMFQQKAMLSICGIDRKHQGSSGSLWAEGTWYIKVKKNTDKGSAKYSLKVKTR